MEYININVNLRALCVLFNFAMVEHPERLKVYENKNKFAWHKKSYLGCQPNVQTFHQTQNNKTPKKSLRQVK